jgi:hypothetical protein
MSSSRDKGLTSFYRKVKEMSQCVEINALYRNGAVLECEKNAI